MSSMYKCLLITISYTRCHVLFITYLVRQAGHIHIYLNELRYKLLYSKLPVVFPA
jgi:hypothetical protein